MTPPLQLARPDGCSLAYRKVEGDPARTGAVWLGGFRSDMEGSKAETLHAWAEEQARPYVRFDYFGHGASGGAFRDGTISRWREDALAVIDELTEGPQVLVGSSMGGWITLLAALARPARVAGLVLLAPAPDFTERLMWASFPEEIRNQILEDGVYELPSAYDPEPTAITRALIEDGRRWLLYDAPTIEIGVPVRIIHGDQDPDVPWRHSLELTERIQSSDIEYVLVPGGDHRLSTDSDLERLTRIVETLTSSLDPAA